VVDPRLALWTDAAIVLLAIEAIAIVLGLGIALGYAIRTMNGLHTKLREGLVMGQYYTARAADATTRTSDIVNAPYIAASANLARLRGMARGLALPSPRKDAHRD
jgi:hypothetical protein